MRSAISIATHTAGAGPKTELSSATADPLQPTAGKFVDLLAVHLAGADGVAMVSALRGKPAEPKGPERAEAGQAGAGDASKKDDLPDDLAALKQSEMEVVAGQVLPGSHSANPASPVSGQPGWAGKTSKPEGAGDKENQQKGSPALAWSGGHDFVAIPDTTGLVSTPVEGNEVVSSPQRSEETRLNAAATILSSRGSAPATALLTGRTAVVQTLSQGDGTEKNLGVEVDGLTTPHGEVGRAVTQADAFMTGAGNGGRSGATDTGAPQRGAPQIVTAEDQNPFPAGEKLNANSSNRDVEEVQPDPGSSISRRETAVGPLNSAAKSGTGGHLPARGAESAPSLRMEVPAAQGQNADAPGANHATGLDGPVSSYSRFHTTTEVTNSNPYQRLDQTSSVPAPAISTAGNRMSVGVHDPALGWVEIKTQSTAGQVTAALVTGSSHTQHALAAQLPQIAQFLSDRDVKVSSLAVEQQSQGAAGNDNTGQGRSGSGPNHQDGAGSQQHAESTQSEFSAGVAVESGVQAALDAHPTRYISVLA